MGLRLLYYKNIQDLTFALFIIVSLETIKLLLKK